MSEPDPFPIIGIGASAGGIEAMRGFFRGLPSSLGAAIVVVTHLSPERDSLLPEVLAKLTPLTVVAASDGTPVEADHVYVMGPGTSLGIREGRLTVTPLGPAVRETKPVDVFLTALALDQGERAVAVILSGGDGDGTIGIKAVKQHGGLTLAQVADGDGPETPDMPLSALRTGYVDFGVPAEAMGGRIAVYRAAQVDGPGRVRDERAGDDLTPAVLAEIYAILRRQVGHDFSGYKPNTVMRRLSRRMRVNDAIGPQAYLDLLRADSAEVAALFRDLLINVTNFFRDTAAFDALADLVIPKLFEGRGRDDAVRVWVPACSTGEEVYSLAILLREHMDGLPEPPRVQIFATDIDERALTVARLGRYPRAYLDAVSPERLARHFEIQGDSALVRKAVRELCTFAPHSVVRDPPFSRLDLVSCRNLLIYLGLEAQEQVLPVLHYALRPQGYLFIGLAENVTRFESLFATLDKRQRIFQARDTIPPVRLPSMAPLDIPQNVAVAQGKRRTGATHVALRHAVEAEMLATFTPPHAVVTRTGEAVHYSARIGEHLEITSGQPTHELAAMARKGIRLELRTVLRAAIEGNTTVVRDGLEVERADGRIQMVSLVVKPLPVSIDAEPLFLVVFNEAAQSIDPSQREGRLQADQTDEVGRLEQELTVTRDRLHAVVEEYETSLEELKSSNEELYSVNEEMQSSNEELEASKEEIQAINEEMHAVNYELSAKIEALDRMNEDQAALYEHSEIASVVLDPELRIRTFTQAAARIFGIQASDGGRFLSNFSAPFPLTWLPEVYEIVRATGQGMDRTLNGTDGHRYRVRIASIGLPGSESTGVVLNFTRLEG